MDPEHKVEVIRVSAEKMELTKELEAARARAVNATDVWQVAGRDVVLAILPRLLLLAALAVVAATVAEIVLLVQVAELKMKLEEAQTAVKIQTLKRQSSEAKLNVAASGDSCAAQVMVVQLR